ncbi:c-type cytochrome [Zobellia galactanivorans]|uniref:Cytochrome c n=1 Tax=Zobellia galactanivorans (strain DSM 12802 / CCUG 47099 / CIP 106680 / NCIMB 13871 / Dsij) TaxID=63186 RepID=G0L815_ZOBGA|nr:cytochrome c [Zobellia galactanivorans]MBU3024374.1 cytochrome c [Zobellia galactanivorans]CAZ97863.1 Cytochrome c [Zobellia galactanivorans]
MKTFGIKSFITPLALFLFGSVVHAQESVLAESMMRGSEIYADFCVSCHLENGEGIQSTFPPLANSDYLAQNREASIRGVKYGQQGKMTVNGISYNNIMPSMGLEDEEIADVMNYIMNSWGNTSKKMVTVDEVAAIEK